MRGSRYWQHGDRHYSYNVDPTYTCPVGKSVEFSPDDPPTSRVAEAAAALKMDPHRLALMLRKSSCGARERDDSERLTDRCVTHGCKMEKRGFRAFVDEPIPADEMNATQASSSAISSRLGFSGEQRRTVDEKWCATKREARQWAWDKMVEAREVVAA